MDQVDLSDFFTTKNQATDFSTRLDVITEDIYHTGFNIEKIVMEQFGIQKKDKLLNILREQNINTQSNAALKDFFTLLQKKISELSVATLTVAFEPKEQTLQAISQWFLLNLNKQILIDIHVDNEILAGVIISFNGKYKDFSLRLAFDQIVKDAVSEKTQPPQVEQQNIHPTSTG